MATKPQTLIFKQIIKAPASAVYRAFTNSTALREWFSDAAQANARPGGRLYLWWTSGYYTCGEFVALKPEKKIVFTWRGKGEPTPTRVLVTLSVRASITRVTVTHSEVGGGKTWAPIVAELTRGWQSALENLKSTLEAGPDLRIVRRPMLGIIGGEDLSAEIATRLGVPIKAGLRLANLIEGLGAQTAGLQKDDVVVKMGAKKITGFQSVGAAMQGHHAGDVVPVVFYRGAEKKTVTLTLSARPLPEPPATIEALAEAARKLYAETEAELFKCFEGVTEAAAEYRPAPTEWCAKEILAHLILGERGQAEFVGELLSGEERWYDGYGSNVGAPIRAVIDIYPTVPDLLQCLHRAHAETAALLAALPAEFMARKSAWWRLYTASHPYLTLHQNEHLGQLKATLQAAQAA